MLESEKRHFVKLYEKDYKIYICVEYCTSKSSIRRHEWRGAEQEQVIL